MCLQEEVFERAQKSKDKAAREAMESQGLIPKSSAANKSQIVSGKASASPTSSSSTTPSNSLMENSNPSTSATEETNGISETPSLSISIED